MLLYQELFDTPSFDARDVLTARRSADHEAFQKYTKRIIDEKYTGTNAKHTLSLRTCVAA